MEIRCHAGCYQIVGRFKSRVDLSVAGAFVVAGAVVVAKAVVNATAVIVHALRTTTSGMIVVELSNPAVAACTESLLLSLVVPFFSAKRRLYLWYSHARSRSAQIE